MWDNLDMGQSYWLFFLLFDSIRFEQEIFNTAPPRPAVMRPNMMALPQASVYIIDHQ